MHYRAFISYSYTDAAAARWPHRALKTYSVPRRLRGHPGPHGPCPSRIYPVFRDREELPTASNLSLTIQAALTESEALIVAYSPRRRVALGVGGDPLLPQLSRGDRVFCLILDGDPADSFPAALGEGAEPLAADIRRRRDGRGAALLKLAAGLLGFSCAETKRSPIFPTTKRQLRGFWRTSGATALMGTSRRVLRLGWPILVQTETLSSSSERSG